MDWAAAYGVLAVIEWLHANRTEGCTTEAMDGAAQWGYLDVVQWLHANREEGCTMFAIDWAAREGHLSVIRWLHENRTEECTTRVMDNAAMFGHLCSGLDIEARRLSHSSAAKKKTLFYSLDASFVKIEERFEIDLMKVKANMNDTERAATKGHLDKLKAATTSMSTNEADLAAIHGKIECVKYLVQNRNVPCTISGLYGAIARRHLGVVEFIYKNQRELAAWPRDDEGSQLLNLGTLHPLFQQRCERAAV